MPTRSPISWVVRQHWQLSRSASRTGRRPAEQGEEAVKNDRIRAVQTKLQALKEQMGLADQLASTLKEELYIAYSSTALHVLLLPCLQHVAAQQTTGMRKAHCRLQSKEAGANNGGGCSEEQEGCPRSLPAFQMLFCFLRYLWLCCFLLPRKLLWRMPEFLFQAGIYCWRGSL